MKSYTDINQSKKLAEILPIESADMWYCPYPNDVDWHNEPNIGKAELLLNQLPCWSLAALFGVIPKHIKDYNVLRIDISENDFAIWYDEVGFGVNNDLPDITADNPIDACYEMIIKLHEQKVL